MIKTPRGENKMPLPLRAALRRYLYTLPHRERETAARAYVAGVRARTSWGKKIADEWRRRGPR